MTEIMTVWKKGIGEKMDGQAKTDENEASKSLEETKVEKVKKGKRKKDGWRVGKERCFQVSAAVLACVNTLRLPFTYYRPHLNTFVRIRIVWFIKYSHNYTFIYIIYSNKSSRKSLQLYPLNISWLWIKLLSCKMVSFYNNLIILLKSCIKK